MAKVLVVGSAEQSGGGVSSVIKLIKKMPVWNEYSCYWLGTQIQRNYAWKLWYAVKSWFVALFIIWRYDIVHFHTVPDKICLIIQLPIFLLALVGRKKIIMHIHMGNQLNEHTKNGLFLWHLKRADRIVLLAKKWEHLFKEKYSVIKTPTTVLYNACEPVGFIPYENKHKSIIFAGYMDDNKAPDILLEAWTKLKDKYPDWKVTLMGNGDVARFKYMANEMGLQNNVEFTGYVRGQQKIDYFTKAAIFVLCSYNEGFPMVVLEAWSYGIPVISTPVGGLPEVIVENKNCCTFDFGDSDGLVERLELLINDEDLRKEMSIYEQDFVDCNFSMESVNRNIYNLYSDLCHLY